METGAALEVFKFVMWLVISLILAKRAIMGPQIMFARVALTLFVSGIVVVFFVSQKGDAVSWVSAILLLAGMLVVIGMFLIDAAWTFGKLKSRNTRTGK